MDLSSLFTQISLIVAVGAVVATVMRLLRQPLIIGHIVTGIIVGPMLLAIVGPGGELGGLSRIGIVLLLFIVGLEISLKVFSKLGSVVFIAALVQVGVVTTVGATVATAFGFAGVESFIIGLALALSSTLISVKLFGDKKELTRLYAQIAVGVLLLQDMVATGAKVYLSGYEKSGSLIDILWLGGRGLAALLALYLTVRYILPKLTHAIEDTKELLLLFSLGWGLGVATLFDMVGFSIEIGALLAGVSLASVPYVHEMASRLKPLRDFFIVLFFISIGSTLLPGQLTQALLPAAIFTVLVLLLKPLVILMCMGLLGYAKRTSFKTAVSLAQVSEFSLVLIVGALSAGLISAEVQAIITVVALVTFAGSTYMMKYDNQLYKMLEPHLRLFERKTTRLEQPASLSHYPAVLFGYRKGGMEFIRTFKSMGKRFVVVDYDPEAIELLERQQVNLIFGDATDPELLEELGLNQSKVIVSTISDLKTNEFLAQWLHINNPAAVFVCSADNAAQASALYELGAAYVMMPHFIGSEKIGSFMKRNGLKKSEFHKFRQRHLQYLETHYAFESNS